jgi:hypothetical protein
LYSKLLKDNNMKTKILSLLLVLGLVVSSCDLDLLDNPNAVNTTTASPTFVLNRIQNDFATLMNGNGSLSNLGLRASRLLVQGSATYEQAFQAQTFNEAWTRAYANIISDVDFLLPLAETSNFRRHMGIAKVIKAYTMITLVDNFGDVPYSEANNPDFLAPKVDPGADVYAAAFAILQSAKADFTETSGGAPTDLFYANNYTRWLKLISTIELKYHLTRKLVDRAGSTSAINSLIAANNFIGTGDDFIFRYGRSTNDPDSRHPRYISNYTAQGGADYMSNSLMREMLDFGPKGIDDPRARYYFYRQRAADTTDPDELRCISEFSPAHYLGFSFCLPNDKAGSRGYWGRDHLNNEGIPPDGIARTNWGIFPAGGRFDNNSAAPTNTTTLGNAGAGIAPIMLSAWVDFMLAEAASTLGTTGDAKALMLSGIAKHIDYVRSWSVTTSEAAAINAFETAAQYTTKKTAYLALVGLNYDNASVKMNVIGKEYWIALFGNGVEGYNLYRRTGKPANAQPGLVGNNFGEFPRSWPYSANHVNVNVNASVKADGLKSKVFWDTNGASGWPNGFVY